jgi:hypothetical protein
MEINPLFTWNLPRIALSLYFMSFGPVGPSVEEFLDPTVEGKVKFNRIVGVWGWGRNLR